MGAILNFILPMGPSYESLILGKGIQRILRENNVCQGSDFPEMINRSSTANRHYFQRPTNSFGRYANTSQLTKRRCKQANIDWLDIRVDDCPDSFSKCHHFTTVR